jgi:hypothetical protein
MFPYKPIYKNNLKENLDLKYLIFRTNDNIIQVAESKLRIYLEKRFPVKVDEIRIDNRNQDEVIISLSSIEYNGQVDIRTFKQLEKFFKSSECVTHVQLNTGQQLIYIYLIENGELF